MMSEGSQLDWACNNNNGDYGESVLLDFDDAIGKTLDFAEKDGYT